MSARNINIDIANQAMLEPIVQIAQDQLGLQPDQLELHGRFKAKIPLATLQALPKRSQGKLILMTAISPTTAGEGKTTTAIGLVFLLKPI